MNSKIKETVKTVLIAVLVSGIVAFVAGAKYQSNVDHQVGVAHAEAPSPK